MAGDMNVARTVEDARGRAGLIAAAAVMAIVAVWMLIPPLAEAKPRCGGRKATIVGGGGNNKIKAGKHGVQVIVAGGGDDVIIAKRNKDIVCGGPGDDIIRGGTGRDKLFGGAGNDLVDGGPGSDKTFGNAGQDTMMGGPGGESSHGGPGDDRLFGELQDDDLYGEGGTDLLVGGHGIDKLSGGIGDDWIRGDVNRDKYYGDSGNDTLSFATATPPGPHPSRDGVDVNLAAGSAAGDDSQEQIAGIENVVGSAFEDRLIGPGLSVRGGGESDQCSGFAVIDCPRGSQVNGGPVAYVADASSPDPGLVIFGGPNTDSWIISQSSSALTISGSQLQAGPGCSGGAAGAAAVPVTCALPATELGYVLLWGANGNDSITVGAGFAITTLTKGDGGPGDDTLNGGPAADLLFPGETGSDRLIGGPGDDAVVGRPGGGDLLSGGPGTDQLVSDSPCEGHVYDGGPGLSDIAGFGHVDGADVSARLGGTAVIRGAGGCSPTRVLRSNEILEGSPGNDVLVGDNRPNLIIGREGNDVLFGKGGKDELRGDAGNDKCVAGGGGAIKLSC
jgi:Ca2+-binding RTX toxin-like protein